MHVVNDFCQRQLVGQHDASGGKVLRALEDPAAILTKFHDRTDVLIGNNQRGADDRLAELFNFTGVRDFLGTVNFEQLTAAGDDLIGHVGSGLDQVDIRFALQPLLHDFHVEQAEEAAAEAKPERIARFGHELEAGVVDRKLGQGIAEFGKVLAVGRIEPAVDHPLGRLVSGEGRSLFAVGNGDGIANVNLVDRLDVADQIADLSGMQALAGDLLGAELAQFLDFVVLSGLKITNLLALADAAFDHSHVGHRSAELVVVRIEDHRLGRLCLVAGGWRNPLDDCRQKLINVDSAFGADLDDFGRVDAEHLMHFLGDFFGTLVREINLVDHRDDLQVGIDCRVGIGDGLSLNSLKSIGEQEGALTAGEAAGNLIVKVDMARRVDQVQLVFLSLIGVAHRDRAGLDGDPPLAFERQVIEQLFLHFALLHGAGELQQAIGERALAVINVGNNAEVANVFAIQFGHGSLAVCKGKEKAGRSRGCFRAGGQSRRLSRSIRFGLTGDSLLVLLASQSRGTDATGIRTKRGILQDQLLMHLGKQFRLEAGADSLEKPATDSGLAFSKGHRAAKQDRSGVNRVGDNRDPAGKVIRHLIDQELGEPVTPLSGVANLLGSQLSFETRMQDRLRMRGQPLVGPLHNRRCTGVGLEVAGAATGAPPRVSPPVDPNMSDFTPEAVFAIDQQVVNHNPATHPGAEGEKDQAVIVGRRTGPEFTKSRGIRIVGKGHRAVQGFAQSVANRKMPPARHVGGLENHSLLDVHRPGSPQPDGDNLGVVQSFPRE